MLTLDSFKAMVKSDLRLKALLESIRNGNINKLTSSEYTHTLSGILGKTFGENVLEIAPDEREKLFGELLKYCYEEVNAVCVETQVHLDREKGLNLQPLKADYPAERIRQAAHSLADPTVIDDVIRRRARSTSENITNSFHDDFVKKNAEFRNDAGMKSYLNRQTDGSCCKWCTKIAGRYDYGKAPEDIFKRHDNCTCTVTFESGRFRQDVWTKKSWEEAPKGVKFKKPTVLTRQEGEELEQYFRPITLGKEENASRGECEIILHEVTSTQNKIFLSTRRNISRKELHTLDRRISKAKKLMNISENENFPQIRVITHQEMSKGALAAYNSVENVIYIDQNFGKPTSQIIKMQEGSAVAENELSTVVHELFHWKDAQEYSRKNGIITEDNRAEYFKKLILKCKKKLDILGINEYNVNETSFYAKDMFSIKRFDEVYTEYRTKLLLKR